MEIHGRSKNIDRLHQMKSLDEFSDYLFELSLIGGETVDAFRELLKRHLRDSTVTSHPFMIRTI